MRNSLYCTSENNSALATTYPWGEGMMDARRNRHSSRNMAEPTIAPLYPLAAPMGRQPEPTLLLPHDPVAEHIAAHLGAPALFFHETQAGAIQVDIHVIGPTPAFPYVRLVTSGMSKRPMNVPDGAPPFAELMLTLPASWQLDEASMKEEKWYWPVALLRHLAHYPHEQKTWIGLGHSLPNGNPAKPYTDSVGFCGAIMLPPASAPEPFQSVMVDGKDVYFHCVVPMFKEELNLARRRGFEELLHKFNEKNVTDVVDPARKNTAKKKFLGLF